MSQVTMLSYFINEVAVTNNNAIPTATIVPICAQYYKFMCYIVEDENYFQLLVMLQLF